MLNINRRALKAYLYLTPVLLILSTLLLWPLLNVLRMSFTNLNLLDASKLGFAGLRNYRKLFQDPIFLLSLKNSLIWTFGSVIGEYLVGLASAFLLNREYPGRKVFQILVLIPWLVPVAVASILWKWILNPDFGILNVLLMKAGILRRSVYWLGEIRTALLASVFVNIWRSFPFYTITILAALKVIPVEELEAARIDGAKGFSLFRYIVFPHILYVSIVLIVLHIIWTFNHFDFVWILTGGGPINSSEILPTIVYRTAFRYYDLGLSASLAVMMILVLSTLIYIYFKITRT